MAGIQNFSDFWNHQSFPGMSFAKSQIETKQYPIHFHLDYEFAYVEEGCLCFEQNKRKSSLTKGQLVIINPAETHCGTVSGGHNFSYLNLRISTVLMKEILDTLELPYTADIIFDNKKLISSNIIGAFQDFHHISYDAPHDVLQVAEYGWQFLSQLITAKGTNSGGKNASSAMSLSTKRVIEYMREDLQRNMTLRDFAIVANLSEFHFLRNFKKETGLTPHQFLIQLRAETALIYLSDNYSCTETAYMSGFSDQAHMNKIFKKHYGCTPRQLQKRLTA